MIQLYDLFFCLISNESNRINNLINRLVGDNNRADDNQYSINSIGRGSCIYLEEISHITQKDPSYFVSDIRRSWQT